MKNEFQLIEEYDKIANLSRVQREVYNLFKIWNQNTNFLYSWRVNDEFAQKLFKFREEFTQLIILSLYKNYVEKLYQKDEKRKIIHSKKKNIC